MEFIAKLLTQIRRLLRKSLSVSTSRLVNLTGRRSATVITNRPQRCYWLTNRVIFNTFSNLLDCAEVNQSRIQSRINLHIPNVFATTCKQKTRMVSKKEPKVKSNSAWEVEGLVEVVGFIVTVCQNLTCFLFSFLSLQVKHVSSIYTIG